MSNAHDLLGKAINYRALRGQMISGNIANIDTPFYKARDIDFETSMRDEALKLKNQDNPNTLQIANTNSNHFQPINDISQTRATVFFRDGHMARNDGNTVDLDVEMSEMTKNSIMYNALTAAVKRDTAMMKMMIDSSRNI